jgi:polysaccharide deacetylase family protein (PEP-CTERM system associated)
LDATQTLLLSVDFEDWHQLVRRRLGASAWERPGPALERQTVALLSLLDELGLHATFFILGMSARAHPQLIAEVAARGHEIASHGDQHRLLNTISPTELRADLRAARATIESLSGQVPLGYRAPAFSLTASASWAFEVLAEEGFAYDSSQHDSPRIRGRIRPESPHPHRLALARGMSLWEFPLAVWRPRGARVPVGGASYWALMPTPLIERGLAGAGELAGLYLHPHEFDPQPLRVGLAAGAPPAVRAHAHVRALQRNGARVRAPAVLRAIAARHRVITYGEAHAELSGRARAGAPALSHEGQTVR